MKRINAVNFSLIDMIKVYLSGTGSVLTPLRKKITQTVFSVLKTII